MKQMTSRSFTDAGSAFHDVNPIRVEGIRPRLCLAACDIFLKTPLRKWSMRNRAPGERFESDENYVSDRIANVERYEELFSRFTSFEGKDVLELGCSSGYLLNAFLRNQDFRATGADISLACISEATALYGDRIRFVQSSESSIPLADQSLDVVYCIDTVEHLSQPKDIFHDVYRLLKPGGLFLIHFGPWLNPCGAHLEDTIPFPWPHVFFSMDTLLDVAAHLYERPDYDTACYWYSDDGERRANPYVDKEHWREFLNDLTIRKFKRMVSSLPFEEVHFERIGFTGKGYPMARFLNGLSRIPLLDEVLVNFVFSVLRKPGKPI